MTGHNPLTPRTTTTELPMFPALRLLERDPDCQPLRNGHPPYWRAPLAPASHDCYVPTWNWISPLAEVPEGAEVLTLDTNGAYLGAIGTATIAHSQLSHTGPVTWPMAPRDVLPGYYRITVPYWAFSGTIVSPLGDSARVQTEDTVWVAAPTLVLLLELLEYGALGSLDIHDSWTARITVPLRKWAARLKEVRTQILDAIDQAQTDTAREALRDRYDRFKEGYAAALSMMLTGDKCKTRRPDWTHTIYAQHAATQWRKAWRWTETGHPLLSMGHTDEIAILAADLPEVMSRPKPPFRYDPTGRAIGALKPKAISAELPQPSAPAAGHEELGDIL